MVQVRISPAPGLSVNFTAVHARFGKDIQFTLDPLPGASPPVFLLTVTCTVAGPGRVEDTITIFTDSPRKPKISIPVSGFIQQR